MQPHMRDLGCDGSTFEQLLTDFGILFFWLVSDCITSLPLWKRTRLMANAATARHSSLHRFPSRAQVQR
jgi:hypothetical protein